MQFYRAVAGIIKREHAATLQNPCPLLKSLVKYFVTLFALFMRKHCFLIIIRVRVEAGKDGIVIRDVVLVFLVHEGGFLQPKLVMS